MLVPDDLTDDLAAELEAAEDAALLVFAQPLLDRARRLVEADAEGDDDPAEAGYAENPDASEGQAVGFVPQAWFPAPSIKAFFRDMDRRYPGRSRKSDGILGDLAHSARLSDHNPDRTVSGSRFGVVRAGDATTTSLPDRAAHVELIAALLAREFANNTDRLRYVIHQIPGDTPKIWSRSTDWKPLRYRGPNPHDKHVHVSLVHTAAAENDESPWFLPRLRVEDMPITQAEVEKIAEATARKVLTLDGEIPNRFTGNPKNEFVALKTAVETLGARSQATLDELRELAAKVDALGKGPTP